MARENMRKAILYAYLTLTVPVAALCGFLLGVAEAISELIIEGEMRLRWWTKQERAVG